MLEEGDAEQGRVRAKSVVAVDLHQALKTAELNPTFVGETSSAGELAFATPPLNTVEGASAIPSSGDCKIELNAAMGSPGGEPNYDNMFDEMDAEMADEEEEEEEEEEAPPEEVDSDVEDMFAQIEAGGWGDKEESKAAPDPGSPGSPAAGASIALGSLGANDVPDEEADVKPNADYSGECDPRVIGYEQAMTLVRAKGQDTDELVAVLLTPNVSVMESLQAMLPQSAFREFADMTLDLADAFNQGHLLIADCIVKDLEAVIDTSTILRTETLYVRLMCQYVEHLGREWVKALLEPVLPRILELELESDPTKLDEDLSPEAINDALAQSVLNMEAALNMILEAVESAGDTLPWQIQWTMHAAYENVRSKFEGKEIPTCGSLLFLRFICPTMTNPKQVGITLQVGRPERRKLILVTKLLQIMANGIEQAESEDAPLNKFMNTQIPRIQQIILGHAKEEPTGAKHEWNQPDDLQKFAVPLATFLAEHEKALQKHSSGSVNASEVPPICQAVQKLPDKYREEQETTSTDQVDSPRSSVKDSQQKVSVPDESGGCCSIC